MDIGLPVKVVGARGRAQVDVRAAGRPLLRVVHRGIHADLLDRLRSWRRDRVADREIDRGAATGSRRRAPAVADAGAVDHARRATWLVLLPLKRLLPSTPFSRKLLMVSRWPLAQMGSVAQAAVGAGARREAPH